jgi:hypothetical protein
MAGKVNVPVTVAIQGLAKTQAQLGQLGKGLNSVGKTAGLAAAGFAAFASGIAIGNFIGQAVEGARDLERNYAGLRAVFEDLTPRMKTFSETAVNMGLSMKDASKSSIFIGSVLKQSGFAISETADLTERLVGLATDLSITYGYDVQEALMGMTALFRGEYDPIEKFGVAMKQSEINSELAARGMDGLTGASRRFAEQQIRVELLFQRSQDAAGAFARQSGTLAVEQLKLAATFDNVRDTVAVSLLPGIANAMVEMQGILERLAPEMKAAFEDAAPVLERLVEVVMPLIESALTVLIDGFSKATEFVGELLDPSTQLGETLAGIAIGFERFIELITSGLDDNPWIVELGTWLGETFLNAIHDIIYGINEWLVIFGVLGEMIHAFVTGDWDTFFNTDWQKQIDGALATNDALYNQKLQIIQVNAELAKTESLAKRITAQAAGLSLSNLPKYIRDNLNGAVSGAGTGGEEEEKKEEQKAKDYVKDFFDKISDEIKKQKVRLQLEQKGASEGLIDSILGSQGWEKIWLQIKQGKMPLETLQRQFNQTAAGAKELADAAKASADALKKYEEAVAAIDAELTDTLDDIKVRFDGVRTSFADMVDGFSVLPTVARDLGEFESAATTHLTALEESLLSAFRNGDLLQEGYDNLRAYAQLELTALAGIQRKRDELAQRANLAESMINEYRQAFTASMSLTSLMDSLSGDVQKRTVTEVSQGVAQLGKDLRSFSVTVSKSYEETVDDVADKSKGLLDGFRDIASKARSFADNLRKLRGMEIDPRLFSQLVQAGVEAGGATAQALVDGGVDTVKEISALFSEVDTLGGELGFDVSKTFYDSGQKLIDQLLAGMRAEQDALETQAETMAEAFAKAFKEKFALAIAAAQTVAENAAQGVADTAKGDLELPAAMIDQEALATLKRLIEKANQYIINLGGTNLNATAGAVVKRDLYQQLYDMVGKGTQVDLTGIESGLSTAELAQRAGAAGANVSNITINVNASGYSGGAQAGQAVVEEIKNFERYNGNVGKFLLQSQAV